MSARKDDGGSVFPVVEEISSFNNVHTLSTRDGMSLRAYAAIKLRIANSGINWLDTMILKANRRDFATAAMQALIPTIPSVSHSPDESTAYLMATTRVAERAFDLAGEMMREGSMLCDPDLTPEMVRLICAARPFAYLDLDEIEPDQQKELDEALTPFGSRVPWEDQPTDDEILEDSECEQDEPAPAAPELTDEMKQRLSAWWRSCDTGLSSEAIALFLGMGVRSEHTPSDAADLGRCLRLLDKIPEWRPRLPEMRDAGGAWPFIVDRWPELEALYKAERWDAVYVTLTAAHRTHRAALAAGRV